MKFEKLNENKVRITLNMEDLKEKNIDLHSFMSSPIESQSLFLDMLALAEEKVGFTTENYKVTIEALAVSTGDFIFTLTRTKEQSDTKKKKISMKRRSIDLTKKSAIYCFHHFDDFILFCSFIDNSNKKNIEKISKTIQLYEFNGDYYLIFNHFVSDLNLLKCFLSSITEFAEYVNHAELFERKIREHGNLIIKSNAINVCKKYFLKKI